MVRVAVAGASGYAGAEVLRLLLGHPHVEVGAVTAHGNAGTALGEIHPHLVPLAGRILDPTTPQALAGHDAVVLALPHGASAEVAAALPDDVLVVDCGADHRLRDAAAWEEFYGGAHKGAWPYGMPELLLAGGARQRDALRGARRVAVPGCYPTSVSLALAPGFAAGLLEPDDVVVVAASGTTGAGRSLKPHLLASEAMGSMSPYGVGGVHRHTPEIEQNLGAAAGEPVGVSFTPTRAPMPRGILATCTARLRPGADAEAVRVAWEQAYAGEPFVHVLPEGRWPRTADTLGANTVHLQVTHDARTGRVVVVAAVDNLAKGTAGAAVQCLNLALGLPEETGLTTTGLAP
ncbi:MAG: N-acetyl-gamma-glutamyl-phosphate reductase [Actinomycetes bacterium]